MTFRNPSFLRKAPWTAEPDSGIRVAPSLPRGTETLAALTPGKQVVVQRLSLDGETAVWLRALGIGEGEQLCVLRRAAFGGPIHVRTSAGGEFAVDRSIAAAIFVGVAPEEVDEEAAE